MSVQLALDSSGVESMPTDPVVKQPAPWEDILARLDDPNKDPFEKMFIVMFELMPEITTHKEEELADLGEGLEQTAHLTEIITGAQTHFNNLKEYVGYQSPADIEYEAEQYYNALNWLSSELDAEGAASWLDPQLREQTIEEVERLKEDYLALGGNHYDRGVAIIDAWHNPERAGDIKTILDGLNTTGTSFKNTSAVLQSRFQFEVGNYETFLGVYKEMFKNWKNQIQSPLNGLRS